MDLWDTIETPIETCSTISLLDFNETPLLSIDELSIRTVDATSNILNLSDNLLECVKSVILSAPCNSSNNSIWNQTLLPLYPF